MDVFTVTKEIARGGLTLEAACARLVGAGEPFGIFETAATGLAGLYFAPQETLELRDGHLVSDGKMVAPAAGMTPLQALFQRLRRYRPAGPEAPAGTTGAVGYLGYDCVRYLERIRLPEAAAPEPEASFLVFGRAVLFPKGEGPVRLAAHAFGAAAQETARRTLAAMEETLAAAAPVRRAATKRGKRFRPKPPARPPAPFTEAIGRIRGHIRAGDIFQCVLSERFERAYRGEPLALYFAMRRQNPSPYHFLYRGAGYAIVGASPEPLVRVDGRHVETHPIAGTRPRGTTAPKDVALERALRRSPKERAEHLMLVDLARNDLGRVSAPGTVKVAEFMKTERFSHVMHLVSRVEGRLADDRSPEDALFACFPAGTLTGAPKVRAMEILSGLEATRRGAYGGAMILDDFRGTLDSCITIRSAVLHDGRAVFRAGAGVVADSTALGEYREIFRKSLAVREALDGK